MKTFLLWINIFLVVRGRPDIIEEDILDEILYNYNKLARPATLESPVVTVSHGINLIKIEECDGKSLKAMTWLPIEWVDPRLQWSLDFYNLEAITLPSDLLWTPDIVLYNSPASHAGNVYNPRAYIFNTGSVSWYPPTIITTSCDESEIDPNTIFCLMRFGSWSYSGKSVDIRASSNSIMIDEDFIEHPEWLYVNSSVVRVIQKFECCPDVYPNLIYNITLRRHNPDKIQNIENELNEFTFGKVQAAYANNQTEETESEQLQDQHQYTSTEITNGKVISEDKNTKDSNGK